MNETRIEEDLLGSKEVPIGAYYGIHTVRALDNFKISSAKISDVPEMVRGMVMIKKASAMANKELHTIPADVADAIISGCDAVLTEGRCMDQFPVDVFQGGAGTSVNMNTNEVIANLALEHMGLAKGRYDVVNPNENTPEGYPTHAVAKLAEVSGLPVVLAANLIEATSDAGAYVSMHGAIKRVAVKLDKVCNDLRLLSSGPRTGLNEINQPELQAGSSIMPAKVNPVLPEVVNQVCFKVIGNDVTVSMAAEAGQLQLNVMEPVIAQALFESVSLLTNACQHLRVRCVDGITANPEVCLGYVMNSIGIVTLLNPIIGHHAGDLVGRECARTGKNVREVVLEMGQLTDTELDTIFSLENLIRPAFRGKVFASESAVGVVPQGVTA